MSPPFELFASKRGLGRICFPAKPLRHGSSGGPCLSFRLCSFHSENQICNVLRITQRRITTENVLHASKSKLKRQTAHLELFATSRGSGFIIGVARRRKLRGCRGPWSVESEQVARQVADYFETVSGAKSRSVNCMPCSIRAPSNSVIEFFDGFLTVSLPGMN
jgi:hypothetical protein